MLKVGEKVVVSCPKSKRLKKLVKDYGEVWEVLSEPKPMLCFDGELGLLVSAQQSVCIRNLLLSELVDSY
jgi:hypothetical protein